MGQLAPPFFYYNIIIMTTNGWISLHRQFLKWEWYDDINTARLFIHCLLKANHVDKKWHGVTIKKGSFVTNFRRLSQETGLTTQKIRTSLIKLISTNELTKLTTPNHTVISITSWEEYQINNKAFNKQITNDQQTNNKQITNNNNKNNNEIREKEKIYKKEKSEIFEKFWEVYPTNGRPKGSKKQAFSKFNIAMKKTDLQTILKGVRAYETSIKNTGANNADAFRWLEDERWGDDYKVEGIAAKKAGLNKRDRALKAVGMLEEEPGRPKEIDVTPGNEF